MTHLHLLFLRRPPSLLLFLVLLLFSLFAPHIVCSDIPSSKPPVMSAYISYLGSCMYTRAPVCVSDEEKFVNEFRICGRREDRCRIIRLIIHWKKGSRLKNENVKSIKYIFPQTTGALNHSRVDLPPSIALIKFKFSFISKLDSCFSLEKILFIFVISHGFFPD